METKIKDTCLYIHTRKSDGGIFYVGIGDKFRPYRKTARNKYWHNTVNKYDYDVKILVDNLSWEEACKLEIKMIAFYGRIKPDPKNLNYGCLVNMTDGGEGAKGCIPSKETREKIGKTRKQIIANSNDNNLFGVKGFGLGKKESIETRLKKSESHKGEKNGFYKKKHSEESKLKISKVHTGKTIPDEVRKKMGRSGSKHNKAKKVIDIKTNQIFGCLKDASDYYGINYSTLRGWLNPNSKKQNKSNLRYL